MADPEPAPEPTPFPIRIINDTLPPPPPPADPAGLDLGVLPPLKRNDDYYPAWDKFLQCEPKRAKTTSGVARQVEAEKKTVEQTPGDGLQVQENAARSWQQATDECRAKVAAIVEECMRLNQKYRDAVFDLESNPYCLQSLNGRYPKAVDKIGPPPWIKRVEDIFDDPQFFIDGASANDVHQGSGGDCWFLASLMAVSAKKELIERLVVAKDEKVGVYGFVFFRDGEWIYEVIDDKLFLRVGDDDEIDVVRDWDCDKREGMPLKYDDEKLKEALQKGGEALYFSHCKSNETWLPLIEKAYAKAHGDYFAIEGGFASEGIEDLTGGVAVVLNPEDIMDKERFWREQLSQVNKKFLFGGGSKPAATRGFVGGHAYAVLEAWEEGDLRLLKLRNPWGETEWDGDWSDGSKLWTPEMMLKLNHTFGDDGVFWISYKDFLQHFPSINRTTLFDHNWIVGQQWTCVNVPWTVDYLDTKFQFTISDKGPVVIVLAQPDDRYFYGLRGRHLYSMHFRVYSEGDDSHWIVRSMHNSGNETVFTRSVSAEIEDLEPGTYNVVFKITTVRSNISSTAEESIMKFAVDRKEKLLHVGRRFDYAQSKGNLRAMEEAVRKKKRQMRREKQKTGFKKSRALNQQERERARKRKKRIDDAMREKRKAYQQKRREKSRARRERALARRENESTEAQQGAATEKSDDKADDVTPESSEAPDKAPKIVDASDAQAKKRPDSEPKTEEPDTTQDQRKFNDTRSMASEADSVANRFSKLGIRSGQRTPIEEDPSEDEYDEPPEELDDDDFDWDSEIDGPVDSSTDGEEPVKPRRVSRVKDDIFGEDPWSALCVLGLRVYSKSRTVDVVVVKAENGF